MTLLYHGTLAVHAESIRRNGLRPTIGHLTLGCHPKATVPTVCAGQDGGRGLVRVVHAMVSHVVETVEDDELEAWSFFDGCINDSIFSRHAALIEMAPGSTWRRSDGGRTDPVHVEVGDWYSIAPVEPLRILLGDEMMAFLSDRDLTPSDVSSFVDQDRPLPIRLERDRPDHAPGRSITPRR